MSVADTPTTTTDKMTKPYAPPPLTRSQQQFYKHGWIISKLPIAALLLGVLTYIFCIIYANVAGTYIGSIAFPYFSDIGRDPPAYYVFATALTLAAISLLPAYYYLYHAILKPVAQQLLTFPTNKKNENSSSCGCCCTISCSAAVGCGLGVLSLPFLSILAIFDTAFYAKLHNYSAYTFFSLNATSMFFLIHVFRILKNTITDAAPSTTRHNLQDERAKDDNDGKEQTEKSTKGDKPSSTEATSQNVAIFHDPKHWKKSFRTKAIVMIVFLIAFSIYIPIGLAISCPVWRLSMDDCIVKYNLGETYCKDRYYKTIDDGNTDLTVLFDYSQIEPSVSSQKCASLQTMRTCAQFVTIVALLCYCATLSLDLHWGYKEIEKSILLSEKQQQQESKR